MVTIDEEGNCLDGSSPEAFGARLTEWGADVVGCNCSVGPAVMLEAIERVRRVTALPLVAQPNAGPPQSVEGRNIYLCSPEYMASYARKLVAAGAQVVGGCCGTTPEHIRSMKAALRVGSAKGTGFQVDRIKSCWRANGRVRIISQERKSTAGVRTADRPFIRTAAAAEVADPLKHWDILDLLHVLLGEFHGPGMQVGGCEARGSGQATF